MVAIVLLCVLVVMAVLLLAAAAVDVRNDRRNIDRGIDPEPPPG